MAAPHVSATVALMWAASPSLRGDLETIRELLGQTAEDTEDLSCGGTADNNVWGEGKLDALAAVNLSRSDLGVLAGTVVDDGTGAPIANPSITITDGRERQRTAGPDGAYSIVLPVGEYTVTASALGYDPHVAHVTVVKDDTTVFDFPALASRRTAPERDAAVSGLRCRAPR